jgi:two-component system, LytTR family, response regulator
MRAIIIDDEAHARETLLNILTQHCPQIQITAQAQNVKDAVKLINQHHIQLVFLDIEMPNENGFALFDYFDKPTFTTIFCTAYSDYACKAFEVSAIDYVLKPVSSSKIVAAVNKAITTNNLQNKQTVCALKENLSLNQLQKIALPLADGLVFIKIDDIYYFEAEGSYCNVITATETLMVCKKIKDFHELFAQDARFFRVHRSYLVNIQQLKTYSKKEGLNLYFGNNKCVPMAREKKNEFEVHIGNLSV